MTSKLSWITFIPLTVAAVFFKFVQMMYIDSGSSVVFGLTPQWCEYISLFCIAGVFLFSVLFCVIDRRISPYYAVRRNFGAGVFGILIGLLLAADGAKSVFDVIETGLFTVMEIVEIVFMILAAVAFIVLGLAHFVRRKNSTFALFYLMPALLCAVRLVRVFMGITTISVINADISLLLSYVFATLFFFNFAVLLSMTKAKNAVKWCFIYGFPAVAALLAYAVSEIYFGFDYVELWSNAEMVELALIGLYILSFLIELTVFAKRREHVIVDGLDETDEYEELPDETEEPTEDPVVVTGSDIEDDPNPSSYLSTADTSDYLYRVTTPSDEINRDLKVQDTDADVADDYIMSKSRDYNADSEASSDDGYSSRMDEIDKLILEISEEEYQ